MAAVEIASERDTAVLTRLLAGRNPPPSVDAVAVVRDTVAMEGEVLAGPFLREVTPTQISVWFATNERLSGPARLEVWNPAPYGFLVAVEPTAATAFSGSVSPVSTQVLEHLWLHRVTITFRSPLPRRRVLGYRLRIGTSVVAPAGTYQRIVPQPGKRLSVDFGTFVVPNRRDVWVLGIRSAATAQLIRLGGEVERAIVPPGQPSVAPPVEVGPTRLVLFGSAFPDLADASSRSSVTPMPVQRAHARLARLLGAERTPPLNRIFAAYLLAWSPALLAKYLPAGTAADEVLAGATAIARMMANIPTDVVGAPAPGESATATSSRRYALPALQSAARIDARPQAAHVHPGRPPLIVVDEDLASVADSLAADDTPFAVIAASVPLAGRPASSLTPQLARRDHTFVLTLARGRGYVATTPGPDPDKFGIGPTVKGRVHEVALPTSGGGDPQLPKPFVVDRRDGDGFASLRRIGQTVVLTLHTADVAQRSINVGTVQLEREPKATGLVVAIPSLPRDDEQRLRASIRVELATDPPRGEPKLVASGNAGADGAVRLSLASVPDGDYTLAIGADGSGARARGAPNHVWKRKLYRAEVESGTVSAIADEPTPTPGYRLTLEPSYVPAERPWLASASGGGKWGGVLGPAGSHTRGNEVVPLVDGRETFAAMREAIVRTRGDGYFIYLLGWWFDPTLPLKDLDLGVLALLKDAAESGVQVRMILFEFPGPDTLRQRAIHYQVMEIMNTQWTSGACFVDRLTAKLVGSHHHKVLAVYNRDGVTAFCGGIDMNRDRVDGLDPEPGWPLHDVHARVRGPAANALVDVFVKRWLHHPIHRLIEWGYDKAPLLPLSRTVPRVQRGSTPVRVIETFNIVHEYTRSACEESRTYRDALLAAIKAAQRSIYIEDQYLVHEGLAEALRAARSRVQQIIILIPSNPRSDLPQAAYRRQRFVDIMGIGSRNADSVGVFELRDPAEHHTYVHSKISLFDDELAVIGSANWNRRGTASDSEVGIAFVDPVAVKQLRVRLWCEHLKCQPSDVDDPLVGGALWWETPPRGRIAPFDRKAQERAGLEEAMLRAATLQAVTPEAFPVLAFEALALEALAFTDVGGRVIQGTKDFIWDNYIDPDAKLPKCR